MVPREVFAPLALFETLLHIGQNFEYLLAYFVMLLAIFHCCKWSNSEQINLANWSHWLRGIQTIRKAALLVSMTMYFRIHSSRQASVSDEIEKF